MMRDQQFVEQFWHGARAEPPDARPAPFETNGSRVRITFRQQVKD
jgi:hypothetical protein